ncbi:MAG: DUF1643 domain-containing protein [Planctomycetota bacterium]
MPYMHIDGVDVKAHFSKERGVLYRYRLEMVRTDAPSRGKTACVVMQNPSYASETIADKSVQFMEKVVFLKGHPEFEGVRRLIVVNQFARIQTNGFEGLPHEVGSLNDAAIQTALRESHIIILAWGCSNPFEERQAFVLSCVKKLRGKQLFKTRTHPSRASYAGFIQPFSFEKTVLV